jgi:ligand-binding sensor protein
MKYSFKELVDLPRLQELTDELYKATGIPSSFATTDGETLTGSGWQRICMDFHRINPLSQKKCIESDVNIRKKLYDGESFVIYECPHGLIDAISPVLIEGKHVANLFSGQILMVPPDKSKEDFFRKQARKFEFDEAEYIKAFNEIPIFPEENFRAALSFLSKLAVFVAHLGLRRLRELEAMEKLSNL